MNIIYAKYNIYHNSIDIATSAAYILRIDCGKAEEGLKTTPGSECTLNALAIGFIRIVVTYLSLYRELVKI